MFRFHVQGFCIGVLEHDAFRVLMLNSSARSRVVVPHHIPTVFAPLAAALGSSARRLPSVEGRWLPSRSDANTVGWDLAGLRGTAGGGNAPSRSTVPGLASGRNHPTGTPLDWRSLDWVLNGSRLLPGGKLRQRFKDLGPDTTSVLEFKGGWIEGGEPIGAGDTHWIWKVRPGYEQAFTSTLDIVYDEPPVLSFTDVDGRPAGEISFAGATEAWIINEAPERARQMETAVVPGAKPANDDCLLYLEAFDADPRSKDEVVIEAVRPFVTTGLIFSTVHCEMLFVEEV
jgi:hypothetical protein